MTKSEFETHRLEWLKEWNDKWRVLDIDFESYMLMMGVTPDEYKRLNEMLDGESSSDDCTISF
jgi:lysyl-tRNA synthetase class I